MEKDNYIAWCEDYGHTEEDGRKVSAYDAEAAARTWAEWYDQKSADYAIASGSETIVTVKEIASGVIEQFSVSGEAVPSYFARKVPEAEVAGVESV